MGMMQLRSARMSIEEQPLHCKSTESLTTNKISKKPLFEDVHARYTTYLKKSTLRKIKLLKIEGKINSVSEAINTALNEYLKENF